MARSYGANNRVQNQTSIQEFNSRILWEQHLCWLYYKGKLDLRKKGESNGNFNPDISPSNVVNWNLCGNIQTYIKKSQWRHRSAKQATLALQLHADGHLIEEVLLPVNTTSPITGAPIQQGSEDAEDNEDDDYDEDEEASPKKKSATPKKKAATPKKKAPPQLSATITPAKKAKTIMSKKNKSISLEEVCRSFDGTTLDEGITVSTMTTPILFGTWTVQEQGAGFLEVINKKFFLIRMIPHSMVNDQLVELVWISDTELHIKIKWPSFLSKLSKHVAFQKNEQATNQFATGHEVFKSMTNYLVEIADMDKKCIIDTIVFKFRSPMNMDNGKSEVLDVTLTDADIEPGETLPPGNKIKVHQLVLQQAIAEEDKPKAIKTTKRAVATGKSLEPDGMKVGNDDGDGYGKVDATIVDEDYINRFINIWGYFTNDLKTREDAIAAIYPYVDSKREETFLTLLHMLLEGVPDEVIDINKFMLQGDGHYNEMFQNLRIHIREEERVREEAVDAATATTTLVGMPSTDIVTTAGDDLSMSSIFKEDIAIPPTVEDVHTHTIPHDIVIPVVNLEEDHEHAHQMKLHVQNRKEADHEKDISVRGKAGSNKLARRVTTRSNSNRNISEEN